MWRWRRGARGRAAPASTTCATWGPREPAPSDARARALRGLRVPQLLRGPVVTAARRAWVGGAGGAEVRKSPLVFSRIACCEKQALARASQRYIFQLVAAADAANTPMKRGLKREGFQDRRQSRGRRRSQHPDEEGIETCGPRYGRRSAPGRRSQHPDEEGIETRPPRACRTPSLHDAANTPMKRGLKPHPVTAAECHAW